MDEAKQRKWLDLAKNARKQLKKAASVAAGSPTTAGNSPGVMVSFRVKFYPPHPITRLHEELTKYQLYLQLRRDLQVRMANNTVNISV